MLSCSIVSDSFVIPWTVAHQTPLSTEFSRQEYWSGLPFPSPGDLPDPGIEPGSPTLQVDSLPTKPQNIYEKNTSVVPQAIILILVYLCEPPVNGRI